MNVAGYAALKPGQELTPFSYHLGAIAPEEVEIEITHCGVCHSDLHLVDGDWGTEFFPVVPGHEIIGLVSDRGSKVDSLERGQRVGVGWQCGACGTCTACMKGFEQVCEKGKERTCMGRFGGFSERIRIHSRFVFPIPEKLESSNTAPLLCAGVTVFSALQRHQIKKSMRVGVVGFGGLGHLAVQFLRELGCRVTVMDPVSEKEKDALEYGAQSFVSSDEIDSLSRQGPNFEALLITTSAKLNLDGCLNLLGVNGKALLLGIPREPLTVPVEQLIDRFVQITGSAIGSRKDISDMLQFAAEHHIAAVTKTYPFSEANAAMKDLRGNRVRYRAVLCGGS